MDNTVDRFTLETQILNCWGITSDLQILADRDQTTVENIQALIRIYEIKFDALWETFEKLIADKTIN